jgi:hypothetical protein
MKTAALLLAATLVASLSTAASAACKCSCVEGQIEPVCSTNSELPPACSARACTVKPTRAALVSLDKSDLSNKGQCRETLVLNQQTGAYVPKKVCQ